MQKVAANYTSWWRGFRTSTHLRASDPTKPLVSALPYAAAWAVALLNLGLGVPGPEKRPNFRSTQRVDTCRTSMTAQSTNLAQPLHAAIVGSVRSD